MVELVLAIRACSVYIADIYAALQLALHSVGGQSLLFRSLLGPVNFHCL